MRIKRSIFNLFICLFILVIFCEFIFYYIVLWQCNWSSNIIPVDKVKPIKALMIADTHLLGPFRGHWFDKLRREWQMHRTFQTAITLFQPEVVFVLGDLFDEGNWVNQRDFKGYVNRFHTLFFTPENIKLYCIVGNHDIGFHYDARPQFVSRFDSAFNTTGISMITIRGVNFVAINSVAMQGDGCYLCSSAEKQLSDISKILKCSKNIGSCKGITKLPEYSKPIVLQHFPMYRESDRDCLEHDSPKIEMFRERWEVLSQESTDVIGELLEPRVAFSGHSHHYCRLKNRLNIEEYTLPSFSWRNKNNPSFILATFTSMDYQVVKCDMPKETTIITIYIVGTIFFVLNILIRRLLSFRYHIRYSTIRSKM